MSLKSEDLKWKGIDLDGTLANTHPPHFALEGAEAIKKNCDMVRRFHKAGFTIVIWTARPSADYINIKQWLNRHKIPWERIETGKTLFQEVWDDRSRNPNCSKCIEDHGATITS